MDFSYYIMDEEVGTDIVVYFYPPVLRVTEGFYFTENVYQAVIEIKQEVNQSWQKLN